MDTLFIKAICDYIIRGCIYEDYNLLENIELKDVRGTTITHDEIKEDETRINDILAITFNVTILFLYHNDDIVGHLTYYHLPEFIYIGTLCTRQGSGYGKIFMYSFFNYCLNKFPNYYIKLFSLEEPRGFYHKLGLQGIPASPHNPSHREKGAMELKIEHTYMQTKINKNKKNKKILIVNINDDITNYSTSTDNGLTFIYSLNPNQSLTPEIQGAINILRDDPLPNQSEAPIPSKHQEYSIRGSTNDYKIRAFNDESIISDKLFINAIGDYIITGCVNDYDFLLLDGIELYKHGEKEEEEEEEEDDIITHEEIREDKTRVDDINNVRFNTSGIMLFLYHHDDIVGHLNFKELQDAVYLISLCTRPGIGYGTILMYSFFNYCLTKFPTKDIKLHSVPESIKFYKNLGFKLLTDDPNYNEVQGSISLKIEHAQIKERIKNNKLIVDVTEE